MGRPPARRPGRLLGDRAAACRDHHERLDGSGYRQGLRREELELDARILAVCDVYDALISPRVYRGPWSHEQAMAHLREHCGTQFDSRSVDALARVLEVDYERALSNGEPLADRRERLREGLTTLEHA